VPITSISMTPLVLEVHPSVPAKTLKEFFDLVRSEPGKLTMASPGAGTTNHLLSELVQSTLGLKWLTVHYRGNAPAANDLIGGQVQFAFDQISVGLPFIKNGMVRALAVTGDHRAPEMPDVPTFTELGYKDLDAQTGSREGQSGGETIRSRADDRNVEIARAQRSSTTDWAAVVTGWPA